MVFSQDAAGSLGTMPLWRIEMILAVWADRTRELGARDDVSYVMPFENRGVEVGVTLRHPHGQIAYLFLRPIPAGELEAQLRTPGLLAVHIAREEQEGARMLYSGDRVMAFVPAFARYAYEIWVAPREATASLCDLDDRARVDWVRALKTALLKLDGLFETPMPYVLLVHQAPTDGRLHPEAHLHIEIYPALRMKGRLKYLAGRELGAGTFTADTLPEEKAAELQAVEVCLE